MQIKIINITLATNWNKISLSTKITKIETKIILN